MSYESTVWKAGDTVTSAKLNKLEQGVAAGGIQVVNIDENDTLDKTWQEIYDGGFGVIVYEDDGEIGYDQIINVTQTDSSTYTVMTLGLSKKLGLVLSSYMASSPDDYPIYQSSSGPVSNGGSEYIVM